MRIHDHRLVIANRGFEHGYTTTERPPEEIWRYCCTKNRQSSLKRGDCFFFVDSSGGLNSVHAARFVSMVYGKALVIDEMNQARLIKQRMVFSYELSTLSTGHDKENTDKDSPIPNVREARLLRLCALLHKD